MSADKDAFLTGANAPFLAELYARFIRDPASVDAEWATFFKDFGVELVPCGPSWEQSPTRVIGAPDPEAVKPPKPAAKTGLSTEEVTQAARESIRALMLIRSFRVRGHLQADLDPLGLKTPEPHPELDYRTYGFTDADLDKVIYTDGVLGLEKASLREIIAIAKTTYCGPMGVEYMHIQVPEQKAWLQKRIESIQGQPHFSDRGERAILERLTEAEGYEHFLDKKYTGTKRFGLEGAETLIPALEQIVKRGSMLGVRDVNLGMAHRGRLNVLANFLRKPFKAIFSEFEGNSAHPDDVQGSGDVKYHLGTSADLDFGEGPVHLSLVPNPSHLEAADPVVLGKSRAKQTMLGCDDAARRQVLTVIMHGDAAMAGQGIVAECFGLSQLIGYRTGGTIHFVINNQIGFTTAPMYSRSSPYCSDVAKMVQAPIFHVNADHPEAVVLAARIATEFRQEFMSDVVVDMVCYRRQGHNEADEPAFTNPLMYKRIAELPTTRQIYGAKLVAAGLYSQAEVDQLYADYQARMEAEFQDARSFKKDKADWLEGKWEGLIQPEGEEEFREHATEVKSEILQEIGEVLSTPPKSFAVNPKILRQLSAKATMFNTGEGIDWATAEALAFGSLLKEGHPVRLSGQDCPRGTFSQRHAVLVDQENEATYTPLSNLGPEQARFEALNSPLSEYSVLGFEYGYSITDPNALVLWEAQFGDFANGAQTIFDQFISSGESKWLRLSGLTVLLPHGMEGQGPEHSSARPERYLQLCAEDNIQVCNLTTPANYFHALRRQVRRNFRKPLILFTPKSLLRHKRCTSSLKDFGPNSHFHRVLWDSAELAPDEKIRRVILCTGKVYYDLIEEREKRGINDVAVVRIEQLYPWPKGYLKKHLGWYPNADVVWCQEEPANMGAWVFVSHRIEHILHEMDRKRPECYYAGRRTSASPAVGTARQHAAEQAKLVDMALTAKHEDLHRPFQRATDMGK